MYFHQVSVPMPYRVPSGSWYRLFAENSGAPHSDIEWITNGMHHTITAAGISSSRER